MLLRRDCVNFVDEEVKVRKGWYQLFCGNFDCPTRQRGRMHDVHEDELEDGVIWLCPACRSSRRRPGKAEHNDGSAVRSEGEGSAVDSDRSAQGTTHPGPPPPSARYDGPKRPPTLSPEEHAKRRRPRWWVNEDEQPDGSDGV